MRVFILSCATALAGCASQPMTPEDREAIVRALNNQAAQRPTYQIIQPQPVAAPARSGLETTTCRTYRNIGGQLQTDCTTQ